MEQLKLENQICFPLYATSRLVIQKYKPLLDELKITYPQYLVLLVLWEQDEIPVKKISEKLFLETNTLTPLLKRMQINRLVARNRSKKDERVVIISLTEIGNKLQEKAKEIPNKIFCEINNYNINSKELQQLKLILNKMLKTNEKQ